MTYSSMDILNILTNDVQQYRSIKYTLKKIDLLPLIQFYFLIGQCKATNHPNNGIVRFVDMDYFA